MSETTGTALATGAAVAKTYEAKAWAASSSSSGLARATIRRREPRPQDVQMDVLFCGVCHSDLHQVRNEWRNTMETGPGGKQIQVEDPDGNPIELFEPAR